MAVITCKTFTQYKLGKIAQKVVVTIPGGVPKQLLSTSATQK